MTFIQLGDVTYNINGFLAKNKDKLTDTLEMLVVKSGVPLVKEIFTPEKEPEAAAAPATRGRGRGASSNPRGKKKVQTLGSQFSAQLVCTWIGLSTYFLLLLACSLMHFFSMARLP